MREHREHAQAGNFLERAANPDGSRKFSLKPACRHAAPHERPSSGRFAFWPYGTAPTQGLQACELQVLLIHVDDLASAVGQAFADDPREFALGRRAEQQLAKARQRCPRFLQSLHDEDKSGKHLAEQLVLRRRERWPDWLAQPTKRTPLDIDLFLDLQVQPLSRYPCLLLASGRRLRIRHPRQHALHNGLVAILRCLQQ